MKLVTTVTFDDAALPAPESVIRRNCKPGKPSVSQIGVTYVAVQFFPGDCPILDPAAAFPSDLNATVG